MNRTSIKDHHEQKYAAFRAISDDNVFGIKMIEVPMSFVEIDDLLIEAR